MLQLSSLICVLLSLTWPAAVQGLAGSLRPPWWLARRQTAASVWQLRQRFVLDLVLQVHKPLLQAQLVELGQELNADASNYKEGTWESLSDFMTRVQEDRMLGIYSMYSQLELELPQQLLGLYRFLALAKDWRQFQRNACYARTHFNAVLFVNALQLALEQRQDTQDLQLPGMHELLPQLYFDRNVILAAQQVNWQQLAPVPLVTKHNLKAKLYALLHPSFRLALELDLMPATPVVVAAAAPRPELSLDVQLNGHWSRLISRLMIYADYRPAIIDGDRLMAFGSERAALAYRQTLERGSHAEAAQVLLHNVQQFVALLAMEEQLTGVPTMQSLQLELLTTFGVPYQQTQVNFQAVQQLIRAAVQQLDEQLKAHAAVNWLTVAQILGRHYFQLCRRISLAINGQQVSPNLLGMATANLRDPIYRELLKQLAQLIATYAAPTKAKQKQQQLLLIKQINVDTLHTFEQPLDSDLINLVDQQLLQTQRNNLQYIRRRLVARQTRLNHKAFNISYHLHAQTPMILLARSYFLLPGHKHIRLLLDSFVLELTAGEHVLQRHFPSAGFESTLSELYEAREAQDLAATNIGSCLFPPHLLLPRGTVAGRKLQLSVEFIRWNNTDAKANCQSLGSVLDWNAPVLASSLADVTIQHEEFNVT